MSPEPLAAKAEHVAIAIATFRRPDGLRRLLISLDQLTFARVAQPRITVVIIDNDAASPLFAVRDEAAKQSRHPIIYRVEPERGLAAVRNACLDAVPREATAIAFIDDDEWAEPQWLDALLEMRATTGHAIIQGPVRPVFSAPKPTWLDQQRFYEVGPFIDGAVLDYGATGNCLIDCAFLRETGIRFNPAFNATGGEDTDFFSRLRAQGAVISAASDAVAYETVPADRMTKAWVLRRQFRIGHTLGVVARDNGQAAKRFAKAGLRFAYGLLQTAAGAPFALLGNDRVLVQGFADLSWSVGTSLGLIGYQLEHFPPKWTPVRR